MKTAAIVSAGDFNKDEFLRLKELVGFDEVVAVDAGYNHLLSIDVKPDVALGDFDSLGYKPKGVRCAIFPEEKDFSDTELAFKRLQGFRFDNLYVFGALGGRLDHTLANLRTGAFHVRNYASRNYSCTFIGQNEIIVFLPGGTAFESTEHPEIPIHVGQTVTLMPLDESCRGCFVRGMKYESDDVNFRNSASIGLSNIVESEDIMIGLEEGVLAIIFNL